MLFSSSVMFFFFHVLIFHSTSFYLASCMCWSFVLCRYVFFMHVTDHVLIFPYLCLYVLIFCSLSLPLFLHVLSFVFCRSVSLIACADLLLFVALSLFLHELIFCSLVLHVLIFYFLSLCLSSCMCWSFVLCRSVSLLAWADLLFFGALSPFLHVLIFYSLSLCFSYCMCWSFPCRSVSLCMCWSFVLCHSIPSRMFWSFPLFRSSPSSTCDPLHVVLPIGWILNSCS